ncbi:hypothetical protein [Candidatus Coxiella mudrowiae]|uniref:hypothetical protein n=1 Tax=Candidatus Coxiella mudrowiae TaxID=2054173 RepID=UPI001FD1C865|nr:hypothetical protein [Candidatus Coxiella mudrowiae]
MFIYFVIIGSILTLLVLWQSFTSLGVPKDKQQEFISIPQTTPIGSELTPRQTKRKPKG